jgi:hypothetical protein
MDCPSLNTDIARFHVDPNAIVEVAMHALMRSRDDQIQEN